MSHRKRESPWLVTRRCLAIMLRVQRGPATWRELVQAVLDLEGPEAYGQTAGRNLKRRLENDLKRLDDHLHIRIRFNRRSGRYTFQERDIWRPMLDLPDQDLETIAWLEQTFGHESPQHDEIYALTGRLRFYLPQARQIQLNRYLRGLALDLRKRDADEIAPALWEQLQQAVGQHRIELSYRSPGQADGLPRRHVADPYELFFDPERGHYYLKGWCHYTDGPLGRREQRRYFEYRLGDIESLAILPHRVPPPPSAPRHPVIYHLAAAIARRGVTRLRWIDIERIEPQADGSALVHGSTDNPFRAVQALMHYRENCRVLGGPELRRRMRDAVHNMAALYAEAETE